MPPRPPPTHFLCVPLVTGTSRPQLTASIGSFKADVTGSGSGSGIPVLIPEGAVRPIGTIHLTLGVMSFPPKNKDDEGQGESRLEQAVALLKSLVPRQILSGVASAAAAAAATDVDPVAVSVSDPVPVSVPSTPPPLLSVTLRGLHSIQPAPKATVLYTAPDSGSPLLLPFCERLRSAFQEAGLMAVEDRPLLLHATIVNTVYVKGRDRSNYLGGGGGGGGKRKKNERLTIDARGLLDRYDDFVWMENVPVEKVAICRMGAKKITTAMMGEEGGGGDGVEEGDEAYEVEAEIDVA